MFLMGTTDLTLDMDEDARGSKLFSSCLIKISLSLAGMVAFPLMHLLFRRMLAHSWPWMSGGTKFRISTRLVSALQSLLAVCIGIHTIIVCSTNIMKEENPWLHAYIWFGVSYFPYDIIVMYVGYRHANGFIHDKEKTLMAMHIKSFWRFFRKESVIVLHHMVFVLAGFPAIEFYTKRLGDFFVGCFFLAEISTPFYSLRGILREIDVKSGRIFQANGIAFMVTFFIGRLLTIPYMFWRYSQYAGISLLQVPFKIPIKCSIASALFLCLQFHWFILICKGLCRYLSSKQRIKPDSNGSIRSTNRSGVNGVQMVKKQT